MLCDICHIREAKIFYTEIVNGEKHEQHLCEECASTTPSVALKDKLGNELPIGTILSGILANYAKGVAGKQSKEPVCMRCGMTASELVKTGRVGCPACYEAFYMILDKNLKTLQGGNEHHGKVPQNARKFDVPEELRNSASGKEPEGKINVVFKPIKIMHEDPGSKETGMKVTSVKSSDEVFTEPADDKVFKDAAEIRAAFKPLLDKAIALEDYEEAARLRDRIHFFEEKLKKEEPVKTKKTRSSSKTAPAGKKTSEAATKSDKKDKVKSPEKPKTPGKRTGRRTQTGSDKEGRNND